MVLNDDVVFVAPRKFEVTVERWELLVEERKRVGRPLRAGEVKILFPENEA